MENHDIEKLDELLGKITGEENGNRVRHLTRIISKAYSENPGKLEDLYNNPNQFIAGIATSAYYLLTGDMTPIIETDFGGFGAIIGNTEEGLKFNCHQLWYSEIGKYGLWNANISGKALRYADTGEDSLMYANISGDASWHTNNSGDSSRYAKLSGRALWHSRNSGRALGDSDSKEKALAYSKNIDYSLCNLQRTLYNSIFVTFHRA